MIIIGITGTIGAGKGTIVEFLVQQHNFKHFSVRGFLTKQLNDRQLEINRDNMVVVANELRAKFGPSYIVEELYKEADNCKNNCIIESIRTPGEITALRAKGHFFLLAVDAPAQTRYNRILIRNSETDHIDFQTFCDNEAREMNATDPNKQNLRECIQQADFTLENAGSFESLHSQIENIVKEIETKLQLNE